MLPLFTAVDTLTADGLRATPEWNSVDIITDRDGLMKLVGWADSSCASSKSKRDFRVDFELLGGRTLLLQRWEARNFVRDQGAHGDSFEIKASHPAAGCEDTTSAGHARIIAYVCLLLRPKFHTVLI